MKLAVLLSLAITASAAQAATSFGGFEFHSGMPKTQVDALINDFTYLYKNPVTAPDAEFLKTASMNVGDGPNFHNWLLNRAHYIIGEDFKLDNSNIIARGFKFPSTPLPDLPSAPAPEPTPAPAPAPGTPSQPQTEKVVVMSNLGAALYVGGKQEGYSIGLKFDNSNVYVTSPRTGLFQVGKGLFLERFLLNKDPLAPANSIFRLGTLAHESRHSDGNGKTTGMMHMFCPKGHPFEGYAACDSSSNGPYTIGAMAERHMLKNCTACSPQELKALQAEVADSFSRIIAPGASTRKAALLGLIQNGQSLIETFKGLISADNKEINDLISTQVKAIEAQIASYQSELDALSLIAEAPAPIVDANPEGTFNTISLKDSMKLMQKSIK